MVGRSHRARQVCLVVGQYGSIPGTRITLVDEVEARALAVWPDPE